MNRKSSLTSVSASRKTHFLYWVSVQQWILVKVMPSSGRPNIDRCTSSLLSIRSTTTTSSNVLLRVILVGHNKLGVHPFFQVFKKEKKRVTHLDCSETFSVTRTTKLRVVP